MPASVSGQPVATGTVSEMGLGDIGSI